MLRSRRATVSVLTPIVVLAVVAEWPRLGLAQTQSRSSDREEALTDYYWAAPLAGWTLEKLQARIPALNGLAADSDQSSLPQVLGRVAQNVEAFRVNFANASRAATISLMALIAKLPRLWVVGHFGVARPSWPCPFHGRDARATSNWTTTRL